MDFSKQLGNDEQRKSYATVLTLKNKMPGGKTLEKGVVHTVGKLPRNALIDSWQVWIPADGGKGWGADVTVDFGTKSEPKKFCDATVIPDEGATHNPEAAPLVELLDGDELVVKLTTSGAKDGIIHFAVQYTELDTKAGKYTY